MLRIRMRKVFKALQRQLDLNEGKNLLHSEVEQLLEIDESFLAALEEIVADPNAAISTEKLDSIVSDAADSFVKKIFAVNQYVQIDKHAMESLKQIYTESWYKLVETKEVEATIRSQHYPQIRRFIEGLYPQALAAGLQLVRQLGRVPSSEYSADLQLKVLRLELEQMKEPILDIGCGGNAYLVKFLRSHNLEAYGIDRLIKQKTDYLSEADWFDYTYGFNKWGSIVSNLSLANHFVYAQKYDKGTVQQYLQTFSKILNSLQKGGSFTVAPAIEQLEKLIDHRQYRMSIWKMSPVGVMRFERIAL